MYKKHFGLERRIFRGNAAGADVFVGPQTASILTGIKKALSAPDAVVTLTGPVGSGKSTAVAHALGSISGKNAIVRVGRFPLQRGELLDLLFDHMRIQQRPQRGNQKLALFRQLLFNLAQNDSRMFLLVEDAPFLGPDMLAELEVVTAADTGPSDGAAIVLMGDDYLKELLASKTLARLRQRIRLRRSLEPCSVEELSGYLRHCFRQAGADFDTIFASGAAGLLHELSGGILRVVNNLVESSMEAAADAKEAAVKLELVSRIADEEFGLTGTFTRPPEISSKQPEPRHSDDATAELVALSMPEPEAAPKKPAADPEAASKRPAAEAAPEKDDDDIPELIQDTQPALAILNDAPPPAKPDRKARLQHTLPDIEALSAELGAEPPVPEPPPAKESASKPEPKPAAVKKPQPRTAATRPGQAEKRPEPGPRPAPAAKTQSGEPPAPAPELKLELEKEPGPATEEAIPTLSEEDKPAWDRDPTLAELRPDLDALERAMAVAQGRDPEAGDEPELQPEAQAKPKPQPKDEVEEIPEITLDDSINRKVDREALERRERLEKEGILEDEEPAKKTANDETAPEDRAREEKAAAELEKIAAGLAKAKTIEDVDDKMAETLFGEELSVAAAAVAARVAEEAAAAAAEASSAPQESAAQAEPARSEMEKEFENVWGKKPGIEVSIDSGIEDQKGGLDISASQRLATVRALSSGKPAAAPQKAANAPPPPAVSPDPIEEQITTSLTQTMKALKVNPDPAAVNDDDDDDERKGGFFSRFRRS
ncbi:MAG TPA: AAA family ATPase [Woeseiaceae bacterium]|nr:AAA family ATPase [Woeseiaceae bacterium]